MKTDKEIKEYIDSKPAITRQELYNYICGYKKARMTKRCRIWWEYILQTKNLKDLIDYKIQRIAKFPNERFLKFQSIYNSDPRIKMFGSQKNQKLLEQTYGIHYSRSVIKSYKEKCLQTKD